MKGGGACVLAAVEALVASGIELGLTFVSVFPLPGLDDQRDL
jgi:hypothetical protein